MSLRLATSPAPPRPASPPPAPRRAGPAGPTAGAAADVALAGVTLAAVVGFGRLFADWSFLAPVGVVVVAAHIVAWAARRLGWGPVAATVASGVGLLLALGWVIEPRTLTLGLPLGATWHALSNDVHAAWLRFGEVRAPTAPTRGFVLLCAAAGWVAAFAADTFAFRARVRVEAVAPSFVLFLFGAMLGADRSRLASALLYLIAVLVFVVLSDASRRTATAWFGGRSADGQRALQRGGLAAAAGAVAFAAVVGPRLPGAASPGLVGWRHDLANGPSRVTVSPLVDIRSRLVDQSGAVLFSVRSPSPSYWRLTSLERFDGTIWSLVGSYGRAAGRLPPGDATAPGGGTLLQEFDVRALSAIWLPAAYRPERIDGPQGVRFDPASSSLLTDAPTSDGLRYSVESAVPKLSAEALATSSPVPPDVSRRYLDLPRDFPEAVRALAGEVTRATAATCQRLSCSPAEAAGGELTPFHRARALQDWFRSSFTYDLDVPPGHDDRAMERFLFVTRRGYCEQFAGTFAAMARSLGLPSRVAVGFTPGTARPDGTFTVAARDAHAWPEVYLGGFGWVAFEPTPGRAVPGAEPYTGVGRPPPPASGPAATTPTSAVTTPSPEGAAAPPSTRAGAPAGTAGGATGGSGLPLVLVAALVVAAAAGAYTAGVPLARRALRAHRRSRATTPTSRVLESWAEAEEALRLAGWGRRPAETAPEYAARIALGAGSTAWGRSSAPAGERVGRHLVELAGCVSAAVFSPGGADRATAARAEVEATAVVAELGAGAGTFTRARWGLDPRPLLRR